MELYPYQKSAVNSATDNLFERRNALIVAATGAGKTVMMAESIKRFTVGFKAKYGRYAQTLSLVHRTEIHGQNKSKFENICPSIPTSELSANRKSTRGLVHFGMVQTVVNIIDKLPAFDLIVIDECHHGVAESYKSIIESNRIKNKDMYLLGVTATPNRGDELPLVELFDNFYQITSKFLIDSHYLVRPKFIDCSPKFGDETGHLLKNLKNPSDVIDTMILRYLALHKAGKTIIFAPSHEFCEVIKWALERRGRTPAYLGRGIDPLTREREIQRFESGTADEIINVDILTEGYDFPNIRNIVDFDTNGNKSQWVQKIGRGLRTYRGKSECRVIDFGGNIDMYPDCEIEVNLQGEVKKERGERLIMQDFYISVKSEKKEVTPEFCAEKEFKPYNPPAKFETLNDENAGIVYVCCAPHADAIIVKYDGEYELFLTNKTRIVSDKMNRRGMFDALVKVAITFINEISPGFFESVDNGEINKMQLRRLACKYPTTTLNFYTANCLLCWETWKDELLKNK